MPGEYAHDGRKIKINIIEIDNGWEIEIFGIMKILSGGATLESFVHFEPSLEKALDWIRTKIPADKRKTDLKD